MQNNKKSTIYSFDGYQVFPLQREVYKKGEIDKITISKKSFDLLMLLIKRNGHVVTKQEMIKSVWPNQIVTDAALSKQITRLRNDLFNGNSGNQALIETVRGVGVRLVPVVQESTPKKNSKFTSNFFKFCILIGLILIAMVLYKYSNQKKSSEDFTSNQKTLALKKPVNLALVSNNNSENWLTIGGVNYILERLQNHSEINTLPPNSKWFENQNQNHKTVAIQMSKFDGIDYVLEIENFKKGSSYFVDIILRQHDGLLAKKTIHAKSLSVIFDKIDDWVTKEINIKSQLKEGGFSNYQTTDYVLETYLRGKEVAIHESFAKASQFYQTATNQDKRFLPGWIGLAEVEAKVGNYKKALALLQIIESSSNFDHNSKDDMLVLKAKYLVGLNQLEEAGFLLDNVMNNSTPISSYSALIDAITIKIQIHFNTGKIGEQTVKLLDKQSMLLKKHKPDPYLIALSKYNLAGVYHQLGRIDEAIEAIKACIKIYTKTNNSRGIVVSNSLLARIYKDNGESGKALLILENLDGLFEEIDGISEQQIYLQYKTENQIYYGLKEEAIETINKIKALDLESESLELKIVALSLSFELNQIHKNYQQSKVNIDQMKVLIENEQNDYPPIYNDLILTYDMFIAALTEKPEMAKLVMKQNLESNPNISSLFEKEVRMINAIILVKENKKILALEIYKNLLNEYINTHKIQDALYYAGYPMLDLLWESNKTEYSQTMNYLSEIATFSYPINKYKAQYLAFKMDYVNAYLMMVDLKSKANQFWTASDQLLLEHYQQKSIVDD